MAVALQELRRQMRAMEESALRMPTPPRAPATADGSVGSLDWMAFDPQAAYIGALQDALTSVVVMYGEGLAVADDEWLTVVARDGRARVAPARVASRTMTLRIRGRDLQALREGRLSGQDARARVETIVEPSR